MMFYKETEFKETPIGKIPKGWETTKLSELSGHITKGTTPTTYGFRYTASGINFIKVESIDERGAFIPENIPHISEEANKAFSRSILRENDVLFSIAGALGRVALVTNEILPANTNQALAIVRLKEQNRLSVEYLKYFLMGPQIQNFVRTIAIQSQQANINLEHVRNFTVALPPLGEQCGVVGVLGVVDSAIELVGKVIAKTERLKKSLMQTLLTKGIGHKEYEYSKELGCTIPKDWEVAKLGGFAEFKNGVNFGKEQRGSEGMLTVDVLNMYGESIYLDLKDLYRVKIAENHDYVLEKGDILFVRSSLKREGAGWASLFDGWNELVTFCGFIIRAKLQRKDILPEFLTYFLRSELARNKLVAGSGQVAITNITQETLRIFRFPLPSLQEQEKIVEMLSTVDKKLGLERREKSKLERVKRGLMDLLLTGKVRVKVD
jgi:type I restriction enzyme S subunit